MRFKRAGFLTKIVVLALLIYMATSLLDLRGQIQSVQEERDVLARQVADQQLAAADLQHSGAHGYHGITLLSNGLAPVYARPPPEVPAGRGWGRGGI